MTSSFILLIALLTTFYSTAIASRAADPMTSADRCTSPYPYECFRPASVSPSTLSAITPPQPTPLPTSEDTFNPQAILPHRPPLPPPEITLTPSSLAQIPHPSTSSNLTPISHTPVPPQTPPQNPTIPIFDRAQCLLQPHCLICLDPTTTLTCYKHSCQCQRGNPFSHYMPASDHSCYRAELCLTCPSDAIPWTWGRMAVCLSMWGHRPVRGEANPLTNWTESGAGGAVVGRVDMGAAVGGSRKSQRWETWEIARMLSLLWVVVVDFGIFAGE